jgi:hypothetical protein
VNIILERVKNVCDRVRERNTSSMSFKKLVSETKREFKIQDIDLYIKTKKDQSLEDSHFYVMAFYDAEDDRENETPIEVIVRHNFDSDEQFKQTQTTEFLIQIFDAVVHEFRHQQQSRCRYYQTFSHHEYEPYSKYLADPDELDAYAFSIAVELLRAMPVARATRYMTRLSVLSKMKKHEMFVSPALHSYVLHFHNNPLLDRLSKKVYKHLIVIDSNHIFQ